MANKKKFRKVVEWGGYSQFKNAFEYLFFSTFFFLFAWILSPIWVPIWIFTKLKEGFKEERKVYWEEI